IRDFHVTGVQTCALPISTATTAAVSPVTKVRLNMKTSSVLILMRSRRPSPRIRQSQEEGERFSGFSHFLCRTRQPIPVMWRNQKAITIKATKVATPVQSIRPRREASMSFSRPSQTSTTKIASTSKRIIAGPPTRCPSFLYGENSGRFQSVRIVRGLRHADAHFEARDILFTVAANMVTEGRALVAQR